MWWGSVANIPEGWTLCDGTHGAPDLTDQFIVCAGDTYNPRAHGGDSNHTHHVRGAGHTHAILMGDDLAVGSGYYGYTGSKPIAGTTDPADSRPPFYALCFIMYK